MENKDTAFDLFIVIVYVIGWETRFCGLSQCLSTAKQVKICDMSTSEFTTINAFFVNVNESSFPETVHKQSESASFVKLVEIHNVDVPVASSRYATVLSPTAGTRQWSSAIAINFETEFDSCSDSLT